MAFKALNPKRIKLNRSYEVAEIADLLGVHRNTVRALIRAGLPTLHDTYPVLIFGEDLHAFLKARRQSTKRACAPGEMYCFKCTDLRRPAGGMVDFIMKSATSGQLRAFCHDCDRMMYRFVRADSIGAVMPGIDVKICEP